MITLSNVGKTKKCNLWIDEKPGIEYECLKELHEIIIKDEWGKWDSVSYVIEIRIIGRDACNYALLGISYKHENSNKLVIKVNSSDLDGKIIESSIASLDDEIHVGIPLEYSEEVFNVAKNYLNGVHCSSGTITFDIAAHGYVGSSSVIFGVATEILLKILSTNNKNNIQEIEKIVYNQLNA